MSLKTSLQARDLLDRMVHEKEITAAFFIRLADSVEDVDQRRWFRRMGQDEKDQRKILIKHRRELWGHSPAGEAAIVSPVHETLAHTPVVPGMDILQALRVSVLGVDKTPELCAMTPPEPSTVVTPHAEQKVARPRHARHCAGAHRPPDRAASVTRPTVSWSARDRRAVSTARSVTKPPHFVRSFRSFFVPFRFLRIYAIFPRFSFRLARYVP